HHLAKTGVGRKLVTHAVCSIDATRRVAKAGSAMTDEQWITCGDPMAMLALGTGRADERHKRYFTIEYCWHLWRLLRQQAAMQVISSLSRFGERSGSALRFLECSLDGAAGQEEWYAAEDAAFTLYSDADEFVPSDL